MLHQQPIYRFKITFGNYEEGDQQFLKLASTENVREGLIGTEFDPEKVGFFNMHNKVTEINSMGQLMKIADQLK